MKHILALSPFLLLSCLLIAQPTIQWQKKIGGTQWDQYPSMIQTSDGGYIAIGLSMSNDGDVSGHHGIDPFIYDIWVVKMASDGSIEWERSFGGSNFDYGFYIQQTKDEGYIFTGSVYSINGDIAINFGQEDCWVVKLAANGDLEWEKTFGTEYFEKGRSVQQTDDGGFLVAGTDAFADYWLFKIDSEGELLWEHTYGGSGQESLGSMYITSDQGCIMTGSSWSTDGDVTGHHGPANVGDYWVVKVDSMGILQWQKSLGGTMLEQSVSIIQTLGGEYLVSGQSYSNDGDVTGHHDPGGTYQDAWIVKLDNLGTIVWQKSFGGSKYDNLDALHETNDHGFIVAGTTGSTDGDVSGGFHGLGDVWILKLSNAGLIEWQTLIGGSDSEEAYSILQTTDGGFAFSGTTFSLDGDVLPGGYDGDDFWIVKLNPIFNSVECLGFSQTEHLEVSPNPGSDFVYLNANSQDETISVYISDIAGQILLQQTIQNGASLNISHLSMGNYSILATTPSGKRFSNKISKQD